MPVKIAVPMESVTNERRVALIPEVAAKFANLGAEILIQKGAGEAALIPDGQYDQVTMVADSQSLFADADIILKVQPPTLDEIDAAKAGAVFISHIHAHLHQKEVLALKEKNMTSFGMELVPRITRAQSMDALSSQAAVAGYKAALIAANQLGQFLPMLTTAAGTIRPAKTLVIGAGVAGLQAIATLRRLGAMVTGYDVRPETSEQVESLGAKFLDLGVEAAGEGGYARELTEEEKQQQQDNLAQHLQNMDVLITTAAIPGRPAPRIITGSMVEGMKPGSVIVDLAAESGGNVEFSKPGEVVVHQGVSIVGPENLASQMPIHASEMYAKNLFNFLSPWIKEGELEIDWEDEIIAGSLLTKAGELVHERVKSQFEGEAS